MSNKLIQIEVAKLYPHPKNPRLDVGDVTELAESIKVKGILQNLTVIKNGPGVPDGEDGYTVIIGHRRRAGAIEAGIETVPCAVVEMDEKEQVSTMLLENMQRSDLTVYEQAQGIQMMLDLGETVKDISDKTGFSLSTIDRRRKLLNLDKDKFKESQSKNVTLEDYLKVSEIEDEDERNSVLGFIGTNDFEYQLKSALEDQRKQKNKARIMAVVPNDAIIVTNYNSLPEYNERETVETIYYHNNLSDERINEIKNILSECVKPYVHDNGYNIVVYKKTAPIQKTVDKEAEKRLQQLEERRNKLEVLNSIFFNLRKEFFENFKATKQNQDKVIEFVILTRVRDNWSDYDIKNLCYLIGVDYLSEDEVVELYESDDEAVERYRIQKLTECINKNTLQTLFLQAYLNLEDSENIRNYHYWNCEYCKSALMSRIYAGLKVLGYQISDEEQKYIDGTHELFMKEQNDD